MDENYEWDSEFPGDMELQETWHLGLAGARSRPELEPELGNVNFLAGPGGPTLTLPCSGGESICFPVKFPSLPALGVSPAP